MRKDAPDFARVVLPHTTVGPDKVREVAGVLIGAPTYGVYRALKEDLDLDGDTAFGLMVQFEGNPPRMSPFYDIGGEG